MPFEFPADAQVRRTRRDRGARAHLSGLSAEAAVLRAYADLGYHLVARRQRRPEAEIDLLLRQGSLLVAVEVKYSATHDQAGDHAGLAQLRRVALACEGCMIDMAPDGVRDMRLDLALVDAGGRVRLLEGIALD